MMECKLNKKQSNRMLNMVFVKRFVILFVIMLLAFAFGLYNLIIGLVVDEEAFTYCFEGFGTFVFVSIVTVIIWLYQKYSFFSALKFNNEGNIVYSLDYTNDRIICYGASGNVNNFIFSEVKHFYRNKEFLVLILKNNLFLPIVKNNDTKSLTDYIEINFIQSKS